MSAAFGDPRLPVRFWAKVRQDGGGCWIWTAYLNPDGYGVIGTKHSRTALAHRVAYAALVGDLPAILDHLCHTRSCANPSHLRPATIKQNNENLAGARCDNASQIRGVRLRPEGCWEVRVRHNRVLHEVRGFKTPDDAERAAVALRALLFDQGVDPDIALATIRERVA